MNGSVQLAAGCRRFNLERSVFHWLSTDWGGNDGVPLDGKTLRDPQSGNVFAFLNDSFEIGFGWPERWHCMLRREVVHRFIRWYLFQWSVCEWFGLRRHIWYWLLRRRVSRPHEKA